MNEEKKKRVAVYDPVAQKKWTEKNKERKKYISHKARARSFLRDVATLDDLEEMKSVIAEREKILMQN